MPVFLFLFASHSLALETPATAWQYGGSTRSIAGSVVLQGSSIVNVRVTIQSPSRSIHRILYADGSGTFSVAGVPVGEYEIVLEAEGFVTVRERLDIPPGTGPFAVQYVMPRAAAPASPQPRQSQVSVPVLQVPEEARAELVTFLELAPEHSFALLARQILQQLEQKLGAIPPFS